MNQWRDYRNYEVSVWTLLDNYIATLKSGDPIFVTDNTSSAVAWPQARAQGQILNGQMELNIDGTQTLSFDIPMYLFIDGQLVENPNWYNNISENILVSMRKIKVIFNKQDGMNYTTTERDEYELERKRLYVERSNNTFEFIITKVSETHELDNLMCHVECEGLAFHELGKVGYKRALSADEYFNEYNAWKAMTEDSGTNLQEPINNIQYWLKKACINELPDNCKGGGYIDAELLNPNNWYYDIRMAHTSLMSMGPIAFTDDIIYEEGFITDWTDEGVPLSYEETRERRRLVDISESNLYNITLDLAEIFEVFCRYEYLYDTNYNIIGRIIVFYNNFLLEGKDALTLMYPNSASKITREMDSSNISTKMFVRSVTNNNVYSGESNIMECSANKSKEDYLLNFDYLHDIGTITDLQYKLIGSFELSMREFNNKLIPLLNAANTLSNLKIFSEAKIKSFGELIDLDKERITENDNLIYAIDAADGDADGYITRDYRNPEVLALLKDSSNAEYDTYYVQLNLNDKCRGIVPDSLELYKDYKLTSTTTKKYSVGFRSFSSKLEDAYVASVPSIEGHTSFNNGEWVDYALEFKGTIGEKPDITALPSTAEVGTKYKALDEDYPYPFKINRGQYLEYDGKAWLVKNDPPAGTKTIGRSANLQSLPDKPELGWIYLVATEGYEINNTSYRLGTLIICTDENTWTYYLPPTIIYREAKPTEITDNNLNNLYIKVNNAYTRTTESKVDTKTSNKYYVRKKNYDKTGFFIYTKISTDLKNGITSATYKSMRYGALDTNIDYVSQIRLLYYVTESELNPGPDKPTLATSSTSETEILNYEELGKWSSYLSAPKTVTSNTWLYKCWETSFSLSKKIFSDVTNIQYNDDDAKDANNEKIATKIANAHDAFLQEKDKILNGVYEYDSYHNLDKVTGLFRSYKKGSYYLYGKTDTNSYTLSNKEDSTDIDNIITDVFSNVNAAEVPSDHLNQYVLIKELVYYSNNNYGMRYYFKYYDAHDTPVDPDEPAKAISSIEPIFYLDTKGENPSTSISEVQSSSASDVWTTAFPVSTKSTWTYHVGWKVTNYANDSFYYYKGTTTYKIKLKKVDLENTDDIPKYIYATFKYKPDLYYEKIKASWVKKLEKDTASLEAHKNKFSYLKQACEKTDALIKNTKYKKEAEIRKFENMMGAALRESYWQPEDEYLDNGARYEEEYVLFLSELYNTKDTGTFLNNTTDKQFSSIGWDSYLFNEELDFYYEYSINRNKVYYPCIDLTALTQTISGANISFLQQYKGANDSEKLLYSVFFNNSVTDLMPSSGDSWDVRYCLHYSIGSEVKFAFLRDHSGTVKPILIVLGAENLPDDEINRLKANGRLGLLNLQISEGDAPNGGGIRAAQLLASKKTSYNLSGAWISKSNLKTSEIVFPRILIPSLKLKTDSENLVIKYNGVALENYKDYYISTRSYYNATDMNDDNIYYQFNEKTYIKYKYKNLENIKVNEDIATRMTKAVTYYTITIKPEFFLNTIDLHNVSTINKFKIFYALSNADLSIYLDAKKILKENAYPKVSYAIEISKWSPDLLKNIHGKLAQLVMINDTDLKLKNTFGYISSVKLDLDHEEKDSVEVKNYKTKFEDLFSKIVAQTEAMHKSSYGLGLAGALAGGSGLSVPLTPEGFEATLEDLSIQEELLEFLGEYFDDLSVVLTQLSKMWNEAGAILASAASSLNSAMSATTQNATILAGFRENVIAALSPKVFTGKELPTSFKPGDIWMNEEDGYFAVATGYSGRNGGFTRTHDGSLAEIKGANVLFDAETGTVDITGETQINLMSGKNIYIAANDTVDIVGNKAVNIGGVTINIGSANIIGDGYPGEPGSGGIHLVATDYYYTADEEEDSGSLAEGGTSRVDVTGEGIEMASKNGIVIKSGAGIDIKSSDNENVSAIAIDKDKGIYLGATKGLTLYSGDAANYFYGPDNPITNGLASEGDYWVKCDAVQFPPNPTKIQKGYDHEGGYYKNIITKNNSKVAVSLEVNYYYMNRSSMTNIKYYKAYYNESTGVLSWTEIALTDIDILGATASLTRDSLLLGMANVGSDSATAISMTTDEIILAAGKDLSQIKVLDGKITDFSAATLSGLLIQKDYIGLATGTGNDRSLLSLNPTLVQLGLIQLKSGYEVVDTWDASGKDTSKIYLVPHSTDEYYDKYEYRNSAWQRNTKVGPEQFSGSYLWLGNEEIYLGTGGHLTINTNNIKIQSKNLSEQKGTDEANVLGMGFALGKNLQSASSDVGLGFWIDGSGNKHLVVDGNITARKLIASSNYGKFIADGNKFGLYDSTGSTGLLTIDSSGNITSGGNLTLSAKKHFSINIYDNADNPTYKFKIDTSLLSVSNSTSPAFSMYCADADTGGGWDHALVGMRFRTKDGLTIRGTKIDFSVGPNGSESDRFEITARDTFYDYISDLLPSGSIQEKQWWKKSSTKYYRAIKNSNGGIDWKQITSGNKLLWFENGDFYIAGNLHTGGIFVDGELWEEYWEDLQESWMLEVGDTLTTLFTEAGQILGAAAQSLTDVEGLASLGQGVLESFYEDIKTKLTPNTSKGPYHEYYFKTGDIWQQTDVKLDNDGNTVSNLDTNGKALTGSANPYKDYTVTKTYIAMEDWDKVYTNKNKAQLGKDSTNGWNRTLDGRIASLEGAKLDVDAKSGTISLKSGSKIELLAKSLIDISSKELEITASVVNGKGGRINISGEASVNIASGGSINLVTSSAYNGTKAIKIDEDGILIESNAKIEVKTTEGIIIKSASDTDAAAIKLNYKDGIYIGTGKKIDLYSGTDSSGEIKGGSVFSMTPDRILMGVTSTASDITTTAIDIGKDQIILAAGEVSADDPTKFSDFDASKRLEDMALSGVLIKADYIGLAAGTGNSRALVSLAPSKILIGVGEKDNDGMLGSYVLIANDTASTPAKAKFEIGTTGIFRVLSPGFILDNSATDKLYIADNTSWSDATSGIKFHATNGLEVKGKVTATEGQIGPWKINSKYIADDTLNSAHVGLRFDPDKTVAIFAGAPGDGQSTNISNALFKVTKTGKVTIGNDNVNFVFDPSANNDAGSLTINAKSIKINGQESWSRDDIIIMKKDSSGGYVESQSDIETRMKNKGYTDWILIKPYYNAEVRYKGGIAGGDGTGAKVTDAGVNLTISKTYPSATGQSSFGNADWFLYEFSASVYSIYQNGQAITGNISLILKALSGEKIETVTITTGNFNIAEKETKKISYSSGHIKTNLLLEGYSFSATIKANGTDKTVMLKHDTLEIKCTCDATNGRVPCTVYYYPE